MARIRTIKPEFVESESVGKLSRDARLLFILLWTFVDDAGRARASSRLLASRLYPYDDDAAKKMGGWLEELELGGHIRLYEVEGDKYLDIPKWLKHQKIDHASQSRIPEFREPSRDFASDAETIAPHTLDLGPVPRTVDLGPKRASAPANEEPAHEQRIKLPKDWRPTDDDRNYVIGKGRDPDANTPAFCDYHHEGKGRNEKRTLAGWSRRWRIWDDRDAKWSGPRGNPGFRPAHGDGGDAGAFARAAAILGRNQPVRE